LIIKNLSKKATSTGVAFLFLPFFSWNFSVSQTNRGLPFFGFFPFCGHPLFFLPLQLPVAEPAALPYRRYFQNLVFPAACLPESEKKEALVWVAVSV
jgi:hypothetical protein